MDDFVKSVMEGTISEEQLTQMREKLSVEGKKTLDETIAFRESRRDEQGKLDTLSGQAKVEEERIAKLKTDADAEEARLNQTRTENSQFRTEQISKAKVKFFEEYKIPADEQAKYDTEFTKLDSGKVDSDLIYKDLERTHVSLNSDTYIEAERKQRNLNKGAESYTAGAAGSQAHEPSGQQPSQFTDAAKKRAEESSISVEAAQRIEDEGYSRQIDG